MNYTHVLFDLDGTLTDPGEGITNSVKYALARMGVDETNRKKLESFIGPPLVDSFSSLYGFSNSDAKKAVSHYREFFEEKGMLQNRLFEGMGALLETLVGSGRKLFVATSKPTVYARKIISHFGIDVYFSHIKGSNLDGTMVEKEKIIAHLMHGWNLPENGTAMVGDRRFDIEGARINGIDSVGVLFGYGSREELESEKPTHIAQSVGELGEILKS